jgi:hypothetical protein
LSGLVDSRSGSRAASVELAAELADAAEEDAAEGGLVPPDKSGTVEV